MGHFGCFWLFWGYRKWHGKVIFGHFIDFGHFPIEIPIEAEKKYPNGKERSYSKNKNSSETS